MFDFVGCANSGAPIGSGHVGLSPTIPSPALAREGLSSLPALTGAGQASDHVPRSGRVALLAFGGSSPAAPERRPAVSSPRGQRVAGGLGAGLKTSGGTDVTPPGALAPAVWMLAKRDGRCRRCPTCIHAGDLIKWSRPVGALCCKCGNKEEGRK